MLKFILRRCLEAIPTLFILITISFFMMRLAPGSPFTGERTLPPEVIRSPKWPISKRNIILMIRS
ncbi:hypothetical protein EIMP300_57330 [Escherichia coli]|uniref:Uncharacterized protein n=1 Tax=Escherichia coli TaxID=562 RepID=A0A8S0FWJ6_ECOLX|nr:hypothetical protein EIMP300_57330 [Escherichia coli]